MRCLVHIGTEKTGSTTLQRALSEQRPLLSEQGVFYSKAVGNLNAQGLAIACLPYRATDPYLLRKGLTSADARNQWSRELLASVRTEIAEARANHKQYVLSSEHFSSRLLKSGNILSLADFLRSEFTSIRIVCYLRRQDRMAISRYTEGLRAGYVTDVLPRVSSCVALPPLYDYESLLLRWAQAFGADNINVRIYQTGHLVNDDIVEDFCHRELGARLDYSTVTPSNTSLSAAGQLALKLFNTALGADGQGLDHKPRRALSQFLAQHAPGPGLKPTREAAMAFYAPFRVSNARLAAAFMGQITLFNENFDDYPLSMPAEDVDAAATLLKDFFVSQQARNSA
jgi:hypothetical protein